MRDLKMVAFKVEKIDIRNSSNELIDCFMTGDQKSDSVLIFVHGFGTDMNEGYNLFVDIEKFLLHDFVCVRFTQTGWGKSEGNDFDFSIAKAAVDLNCIIEFFRNKFPKKDINIIAHSLGCYVTTLLSPDKIAKVVFTGVPCSDANLSADAIKARMARNTNVDEEYYTNYLRSSGEVQRIGTQFWKTLRSFDFVKSLTDFSMKTSLTVIVPKNDGIIDYECVCDLEEISSLKYMELEGNHNFTKKEDREELLEYLMTILGL